MKKTLRQIAKVGILTILLLITALSCQQGSEEVSTPQADFYNEIGISDKGIIVENIVNLKGMYRFIPEDKSVNVDITVDFKTDNNSDWITNIDGNVDKIPKKYKVFADALYVTHDLNEFDKVISELRKKDNKIVAEIAEQMISKIPEVDKYRIELAENDTIKLFGSRINFDLVKVQ